MRIGDRSFYPKVNSDTGKNVLLSIAEKKPSDIPLVKDETSLKGKLPFSIGCDIAYGYASIGDVLLLNSDEIAICFGDFAGEFSKIARIEYPVEKGLPSVFGDGHTLSIHMEWSE